MFRRLSAQIAGITVSIVLVGCARDARVAQLERRVDSLAVTLTALVNARRGGDAPALSESLTVSSSGAGVAGQSRASVVVVEFTDYQCPFCARHFKNTLPALRAEYVNTGKVRYVVRDLPLTSLHPYASNAAKAARCAAAQGDAQYWKYHDALFERQPQIADTLFVPLARSAGLNVPAFQACLTSAKTAALIERDMSNAQTARLTGTPAFVIGRATGDSVRGVVLRGAYPIELFRQAIDAALGAVAVADR